MEIKRGLPLVFLFFLYSANGFGASFDCTKAKSFSEQTICGNHEISQMDDELKIVYDKAKDAYKNKVEFKNITKNMWNEREKCTSEECVRKWYSDAFTKYAGISVEVSGKDNLETEFIAVVSQAQVNGSAAKNDMAVGGIKFKRDDQICSLISSSKVNSWTGKIKSLDANGDGYGVLSIEIAPGITLNTWSNSFSDRNDQTLINPTSPFFKTVSGMAVGDNVEFSGHFIPGDNGTCVNESSLGLHGGLSEPEFIFKFSDVSKLIKKIKPHETTPNSSVSAAGKNKVEVITDYKGVVLAAKGLSAIDGGQCDIQWGAYKLTKLQYGSDGVANLIEFTNEIGDSKKLVFPIDFDNLNDDSLANVQRENLKVFPEENDLYFITYTHCGTSADGGDYEYKLIDMYLLGTPQ